MVYTTKRKAGPQQALSFLRKRIARIYPLYWVWTSVLVIFWLSGTAKLGGGQDHHQHYSVLYIVNSYLLIPTSNGENFHPLLAQGWTLSFEMFFYVVFSGSIAFRLTSRKLIFLLSGFLVLAVVGSRLRSNSGLHYLFDSSIIIEFLYGVLVAEILGRFGPQLGQTRPLKSLPVSLMVIGGAGLLCTISLSVTDSWRFIFYGIPALLIAVGAAISGNRPAPRLLAYLGDSSYSIYLVHGFFAMAYASGLKHLPWINTIPADPMILILGSATIILSSFTYSLVERPLTRLLSHQDHGFTNLETEGPKPKSPDQASRQIV